MSSLSLKEVNDLLQGIKAPKPITGDYMILGDGSKVSLHTPAVGRYEGRAGKSRKYLAGDSDVIAYVCHPK